MKKSLSSSFNIDGISASSKSMITNKRKEIRGQKVTNRYIIIWTIISLLLLFSRAEIRLETIAKCNKEKLESLNLESSIVNPVFGYWFFASGSLHCLRFFHPDLEIEYEDNFLRQFIKDKCSNDNTNMLLKPILFLFPSNAGT